MIYDEVLERPYMLSPRLVEDSRLISFKVTKEQDFEQFIKRYFDNLDIKIYSKNGVDYLDYIPPKPATIKRTSYVYSPQFRDVAYLAEFLKGNSDDKGAVSASGDKLVYYGTPEEIARAKNILKSVDTQGREVVVTGYVYEVQTGENEGSGINLLAKLLSGKLGISIGIKQNYENFITVNTGNLDAMIELFRTDTRFQVVSSPTLRVKSGSRGNFSVGSEVPTLGDVTYQDGRSVQSVTYRSSGVIFDILPTIKSHAIDLKIQQTLSNFVKTETGVNNTPTLIKRDLITDVTVKSGDVIVLGGLAQNKDNRADTGFSFLPSGWFTGKSATKEKTDIVILLQVKEV
ncbi:type II secretion system protein GspD [Actinobacillus sp. GY-402]|nr:type II secretion system protein GspD [Actinobacillus sp. GY-402]QOF68644.1 type II secretion system protein GspD [Actinobacillus sp. GY-402]